MVTGGKNGGMHAYPKGVAVAFFLLIWSGGARATVKIELETPEPKLVVPAERSSEGEMRESFRRDVERHPLDYVSFLTETGAKRFMQEHSTETSRETVQRMLDLGVVGYWQGRTVVVLPITPGMTR